MPRPPDGLAARTRRIAFRITEDGYALIEQAAARHGETVSEYARKAAAQRTMREPLDDRRKP